MDASSPDHDRLAEPSADIYRFERQLTDMDQVRRRTQNLGASTLSDRELLALQLMDADVASLTMADRLIGQFGSVGQVLATPEITLARMAGSVVAAQLGAIRELARRVLLELVAERPVMSCWREVETFLRHEMGRSEIEIFAALWLDNRNNLIQYEILSQGDVAHAPVYAKQFVKRAIERNCAAAIIAHCHPAHSDQPSRGDILMTKKLVDALALVDIKLHDHVIVAGDKVVSMKTLGLI